jgi:hypothetical protein
MSSTSCLVRIDTPASSTLLRRKAISGGQEPCGELVYFFCPLHVVTASRMLVFLVVLTCQFAIRFNQHQLLLAILIARTVILSFSSAIVQLGGREANA